MRSLELRSTPKTLTTALNSWETLEVFDVVKYSDERFFNYTVDGFVITLRERGTYHFEMVLNLTTSEEVAYGIKIRLNVDGIDEEIKAKGYSETAIIFNEYLIVDESTLIIIEVYFETDEVPDLVVNVDNMLYITKKS